MIKHTFSICICALLCFVSVINTQAQLSKKHFIPPLTYAETGNANPENQYFYISTPSNINVSYTIKQIGSPTNNITGVVSSTSPQEIYIGNGNSQLFIDSNSTSIVHDDKGYIIEADDVIYVSIRVLAGGGAQAGALVSKGNSALGTTFRAGMFTNENPQSNYLNFISVMATENNTLLSFDDLPAGILIRNYSGTLPISNIILNEGESYIVATNANDNIINRDALIGTLITSNKPIVVNTGSANGSFHNGGGRDYGLDQIVGVDKIGDEYIFVKGNGNNDWENILIVAHKDATTISINGGGVSATINKGQYYLIEGAEYNSNGNMYVQTSNPVFTYQGIGANNSEANQSLFFVPPLSCENKGGVDNIPDIQNIGSEIFTGGVTIVTNKGAIISINSKPISDFSPSGPFDVDGNTNYVTYRVTNLTGNISIDSSGELYCAYFNENGAATSGSFYSGFPSAPEINLQTTLSTLGGCIPNITLESVNTSFFDSVEWFYNDGTGFVSTGNTTGTLIPSLPGNYVLTGTLACSGSTFDSQIIPVSFCPDDIDNDLIIDNIDVDLDNDGILNCDESKGNTSIDFTDPNSPILNFIDGSSDSSFISSTLTQIGASTFSGDGSSNFNSTVSSGADSELEYILNFNEASNIELTQNTSTTHSNVTGEIFILKIEPNTKNITLIDPDNILLVDTDFDDVFETGVTTFSSAEIRFKFNPTPSGSTPYKLVANSINQLIFKHLLNNTFDNSTFEGNLILTCFGIDSDQDGVVDAFDADSDNDGIPDIIEAQGIPVSLFGTDTNLDGLDDVFTSFITPIDSDNDGVYDYLDLDSDNDGVYDLWEAGHPLLDVTLTDGQIDDVDLNIGINGLDDRLETAPDNFILNYTISDPDTDDSLFSYLDLDSDGDECPDVIEAGFLDPNNDNIIGPLPVVVDDKGKVIVTDGYTIPNSDYSSSAPILLNTPFQDVAFCEASTSTISIDSTADTFQWEISTDGGTNWSNIIDDATYSGATTKDLEISNLQLTSDNNLYRVFLQRTGNSCDDTSNEITLTVDPLPIIKNNITPLEQCITTSDPNPTVNLTLSEVNISSTPNLTFEYYKDPTGATLITTPTSYPVIANTSQSVYVKVISDQGCSEDLVTLTINVGQTPDNPFNALQPPVCDDFLDEKGNDSTANSDTDFITNFSLDSISIVNSINPPINTKVFFYENQKDRTEALNEIYITKYRNNISKNDTTRVSEGIQFPIYYKILSTINNDCQGLGQFYLQVNSVPIANTPANFELCDDAISGNTTDGINTGINLRDRVDSILGSTQTELTHKVTFHTSQADADDVTSMGIPNADVVNYTNTPQAGWSRGDISEETIYVRVQNKNTQCVNNPTSFKIMVNPIPSISTTITTFPVCDVVTPSDGAPRNRIAQNIDLTSKNDEVLAGKINHRVAYYLSQSDAENNIEIVNATDFENMSSLTSFPSNFNSDDPATQTIFVKVFDLGGNKCSSIFSTFQLVIYPEPNIPLNISDYTDCDNTTDIDADDENGRNGDITLKNKIPEILKNYSSTEFADFSVRFYATPLDAEIGDLDTALDENIFENDFNGQEIFVRVENIKNSPIVCVNTRLSFKINIKSLPNFFVIGEENIDDPQIVCLNNTPLILEAENPDAIYDYQWTNEAGEIIGNDRTLGVTTAGKYTVTASDILPNGCSRSRTIVVKESNIATLEESFITIIDEATNIGNTDNISVSIDIISNNLGPGEYQFAITNEDTGKRYPFSGFQDEPIFENLEGGIYTITVNDKNGCAPDTELQISVIQFPKFFTPNGDGKNDVWSVKGANKIFYPNSSIDIFNRFGKLVAQIPIDSQGWDGTYNGTKLSSDDYWFRVQLIPANTSKVPVNKKGHFSLLRR